MSSTAMQIVYQMTRDPTYWQHAIKNPHLVDQLKPAEKRVVSRVIDLFAFSTEQVIQSIIQSDSPDWF
jgi:hypothetical protein